MLPTSKTNFKYVLIGLNVHLIYSAGDHLGVGRIHQVAHRGCAGPHRTSELCTRFPGSPFIFFHSPPTEINSLRMNVLRTVGWPRLVGILSIPLFSINK